MWTDNTRNAKVKGGPNRSVYDIKWLITYENIDSNIFSKLKKVK